MDVKFFGGGHRGYCLAPLLGPGSRRRGVLPGPVKTAPFGPGCANVAKWAFSTSATDLGKATGRFPAAVWGHTTRPRLDVRAGSVMCSPAVGRTSPSRGSRPHRRRNRIGARRTRDPKGVDLRSRERPAPPGELCCAQPGRSCLLPNDGERPDSAASPTAAQKALTSSMAPRSAASFRSPNDFLKPTSPDPQRTGAERLRPARHNAGSAPIRGVRRGGGRRYLWSPTRGAQAAADLRARPVRFVPPLPEMGGVPEDSICPAWGSGWVGVSRSRSRIRLPLG